MTDTRYTAPVTADQLRELGGHYRIHCTNEAVPSAMARQIKAAGGEYSECRGHSSTRYVSVPFGYEDLADAVIRKLGLRERASSTRKDWTHVTVITNVRNMPQVDGCPDVQHVPHDDPSPVREALDRTAREVTRRRIMFRQLTGPLTRAEQADHDARAELARTVAQAAAVKAAGEVVDSLRLMLTREDAVAFLLAQHVDVVGLAAALNRGAPEDMRPGYPVELPSTLADKLDAALEHQREINAAG